MIQPSLYCTRCNWEGDSSTVCATRQRGFVCPVCHSDIVYVDTDDPRTKRLIQVIRESNTPHNADEVYNVTFDLWGKRCRTWFFTLDEAVNWLKTCYEKGFLLPIEINKGEINKGIGTIIYKKEQLIDMMP